jgi:cytochrome c oxidase subunit 2
MQNFSLILGVDQWMRNLWLKPGNSDLAVAGGVDDLFMFIMWVCIISFVLLMVPMCWWTIRYIRRPGVTQVRTPNHNTLIETLMVGIPLVVVTIIFFWGFHGYMHAQIAHVNAETINVGARQWGWNIVYKNGASSQESIYLDDTGPVGPLEGQPAGTTRVRSRTHNKVPIIVVPEGRPVKFLMTSTDVLHAWYIPDMRIKMDVIPNRFTSFTFIPQSASGPSGAGKFYEDKTDKKNISARASARDSYIFCAEYCGQDHGEMAGVLRVVSESDYNDILKEWGDVEGTLSLVELGQLIHEKQCASCHTVTGSGGSAPSWKGFYGKAVPLDKDDPADPIDWSKPDAWENYIAESIVLPAKRIHAGYPNQMNAFNLTPRQIAGVQAYFRKLNSAVRDGDEAKPTEKPADAPAGAPADKPAAAPAAKVSLAPLSTK